MDNAKRSCCCSSKPVSECADCSCWKIKPVTSPVQHGEGPYWHIQEQALYYVDTFTATILRWQTIDNVVTSHKILESNSVGIIVPIRNANKQFLVCHDRFISKFIWNGEKNDSGCMEELSKVDSSKPTNQFNDGKADSLGRVWAGTLTRMANLSVSDNGGSLYLITEKNMQSPEEKISNVSISNGIAWSKNDKEFFFIDSATRKIIRYNFDLKHGTIDFPHTLFDLKDYPHIKGIPDGMTIDANDNLWVALFGGKSILQINSKTGKLLRRLKMPVTYITSVAFGGKNLDILYATTSKLKLDKNELLKEPMAGSIFAIHNLGVRGLPANEFQLQITTE